MKWLTNLWRTLNKPTKALTLGAVSISAFIMGIIFWGGFNTALEATNTEAFCISCHSMESKPYQELQELCIGRITLAFAPPARLPRAP